MIRGAAVAVLLGACATSPSGMEPPMPPGMSPDWHDPASDSIAPPITIEPPGMGWTGVGFGVEYQRINTGHAILIAYGGYTAQLSYSAAWSTELIDAKLGAVDVGHVYAVQGPADSGYTGKEIQNSKLRAHLATIYDGHSPIYVIAHSSGAYVANELFGQLSGASNTAVLSRITYACLEGGGSGLTPSIVSTMHQLTFVYAHDPTLSQGYSENTGAEQSLGSQYAPHATTFEVVVPATGCDDGAGWCLHDVVVTHKPHNPAHFDLADDYTDFVNRPITTEYLDPLIPGA